MNGDRSVPEARTEDAMRADPLVIDGDEIACIEEGIGDPSYLKYTGQVWINTAWLDRRRARALRDWLNEVLS